MSKKKLSDHIRHIIDHCYACQGAGTYMKGETPMACLRCGDWRTALKDVEKLEALLFSHRRIANNVIYFDDSSDYPCALREICATQGMDEDDIGAKFIEDTHKDERKKA